MSADVLMVLLGLGGLTALVGLGWALGRARRDAEIERETANEQRRIIEETQAVTEDITKIPDKELDKWL